jgi:dGTPase
MPHPDPAIFEPPNWLDREEEVLAPYAMKTRLSRGRRHPEDAHPFRTPYQRDRDRIVHSTAFRRLMYKTQVLLTSTDDHHRTRLTHTLEVAQISRTIARQLGLNEDLTEAIALAHDLGHPPFGHAGEEVLDQRMQDNGGFEHNRHGLRILELLEYRYADFPGLNLTWEVLEAQALHSKHRHAPDIQEFARVGQPLLEAQLVDVTDSLAYDTHDIDDALSLGLITTDDLQPVEFWRRSEERVRRLHTGLTRFHLQATVVRDMINWQVDDLLQYTRHRIGQEKIRSVADVRAAAQRIVSPSPEVCVLKAELESFLRSRVYGHYRVMRMSAKGRRIVDALFTEFRLHPQQLRDRYALQAQAGPVERAVCDYLAGMTDHYAQDEYLRLFQPYSPV